MPAGVGVTYASDPDNFVTGEWVHVAETFDPVSQKYTLYKNGVYVAS